MRERDRKLSCECVCAYRKRHYGVPFSNYIKSRAVALAFVFCPPDFPAQRRSSEVALVGWRARLNFRFTKCWHGPGEILGFSDGGKGGADDDNSHGEMTNSSGGHLTTISHRETRKKADIRLGACQFRQEKLPSSFSPAKRYKEAREAVMKFRGLKLTPSNLTVGHSFLYFLC